MNEIVKRNPTAVAADGWDDTAAEAEARLIRGSLLKFSDRVWSVGKEAIEVEKGRRLIAVATAAAWVRWKENKPVEYRLRQPGVPMPERKELGDNNQDQWEAGPDGEPRDPWQSTRFVHMIDEQTAEAFTFTTSSGGGKDCVINLADQIKRMRGKHADAVPVVELGFAPMKTRWGPRSRPTLKVVGWRTTDANVVVQERQLPPPTKAQEMDDDIPF